MIGRSALVCVLLVFSAPECIHADDSEQREFECESNSLQSYWAGQDALVDEGRIEEALPLALESAAAVAEQCGEITEVSANSLSRVGNMQADLAQHGDAEATYRRVLEIREAVFGVHSADAANTYRALGFLYLEMGKYDEARAVLNRALDDFSATLGADSAKAGSVWNVLGILEYYVGDIAAADAAISG